MSSNNLTTMKYIKWADRRSPKWRAIQLSRGQWFDVEVVAMFEYKGDLEKEIHSRLADYRLSAPSGRKTEWFRCNKDFIIEIARDLVSHSEQQAAPGSAVVFRSRTWLRR